ncbi:MAG: NAD-dependent epimerase/dehydratase family protein [Gammaproteobacteria bacterium]
MRIAVFGGSGFLGYDFVRRVLAADRFQPVVYAGSARGLANLARHEIDIRLYDSACPGDVVLDREVEAVINFSHPFQSRGGISGAEQVRRFAAFVGDARRRQPRLRLVHVSSMSVYEPFAPGIAFSEDSPLRPPRADRYAREKVSAEEALHALPDAPAWQLHLRPTVVYGPFGGVWTDRIFEAFHGGDVAFQDLGGRIQPIWCGDVSDFILARLAEGAAGVFNLAGPEQMSWHDFLAGFAAIAARGRLVEAAGAAEESAWRFYRRNLRELVQGIRRDPAFDRMAVRIATHLPDGTVPLLRRLLFGGKRSTPAATHAQTPPVNTTYLRPFFAEDRLVDPSRACAHEDFRPRSFAQARATLADYHAFRYGLTAYAAESDHG